MCASTTGNFRVHSYKLSLFPVPFVSTVLWIGCVNVCRLAAAVDIQARVCQQEAPHLFPEPGIAHDLDFFHSTPTQRQQFPLRLPQQPRIAPLLCLRVPRNDDVTPKRDMV